jgi:hypothetical protein
VLSGDGGDEKMGGDVGRKRLRSRSSHRGWRRKGKE